MEPEIKTEKNKQLQVTGWPGVNGFPLNSLPLRKEVSPCKILLNSQSQAVFFESAVSRFTKRG